MSFSSPELAPSLAETLQILGDVMRSARKPWWIIGSAAAALHGARPIQVSDVDLLLQPEDAARVASRVGVSGGPGKEDRLFRSDWFGIWSVPPLPVEIMSGFHYRDGPDWRLVAPATRQAISLGERTLYVPVRSELRRIFLAFGRPKDLERAQLLADDGSESKRPLA